MHLRIVLRLNNEDFYNFTGLGCVYYQCRGQASQVSQTSQTGITGTDWECGADGHSCMLRGVWGVTGSGGRTRSVVDRKQVKTCLS